MDEVSSLGDAQDQQGLLLPSEPASHMLVFAKPFSAITSVFLGELSPPKHLLKVLTPLLLVQLLQKQTGNNRHGGSVPLGSPASVLLKANNFQPSVPNIQCEVKRRTSEAPSWGEVGPESAWSNHHDHLLQGVVVCVLPRVPHDTIRPQDLAVFNGVSATL